MCPFHNTITTFYFCLKTYLYYGYLVNPVTQVTDEGKIMAYYTMPVKVDEGTWQVLRRMSRQYDLPMGALIGIATSSVLDWNKLVKAYFNVCPYCRLANNSDALVCIECGTPLTRGEYVPSEIFGGNDIMNFGGLIK